MNIDIATLFPEMLENYLSESVVGRARAKNIFTVTCHNIRDYTQDKHRRVDDTPYSERQGMLMQCEPIYNCYKSVTAYLYYAVIMREWTAGSLTK